MNILEVFESVKGLTGTIAVSPTSVTVNKGGKAEIYPLTGEVEKVTTEDGTQVEIPAVGAKTAQGDRNGKIRQVNNGILHNDRSQ